MEKNLCRIGLCERVIRVNNGREGLNLIRGSDDQVSLGSTMELLVLLDLNMPVVDGYSVLQALKANPRTRAIPIIVMTTTSDVRDIERCYELGCNLYLTKPVDYAKFQQMIFALGELLKVVTVPVRS